MSLLNAWVSKDRGLVAVDTDGLIPSRGEHFGFSKLIPLVHANSVIAARGDRAYLHLLFSYYFLAEEVCIARDYDALVDNANHAIASVNNYCNASSQLDVPYHFVIMGWSIQQNRVRGRQYVGSTRDVGVDVEELGQVVSPHDCFVHAPIPRDHGTIAKMAREQANWLRSLDTAGGGDLVIAEIRKSGIEIRKSRID